MHAARQALVVSLPPLTPTARQRWLQQIQRRNGAYQKHATFFDLEKAAGRSGFKRSAFKKHKEWEMLSTNLHIQVRVRVAPCACDSASVASRVRGCFMLC